jgi:hypothetical protein
MVEILFFISNDVSWISSGVFTSGDSVQNTSSLLSSIDNLTWPLRISSSSEMLYSLADDEVENTALSPLHMEAERSSLCDLKQVRK